MKVERAKNRWLDCGKFLSAMDMPIIPSISYARNGELNVFFDTGGIYLDVGFFGDGTYSYYAKLPSGRESSGDDIDVSEPLPACIMNFLGSVTIRYVYAKQERLQESVDE